MHCGNRRSVRRRVRAGDRARRDRDGRADRVHGLRHRRRPRVPRAAAAPVGDRRRGARRRPRPAGQHPGDPDGKDLRPGARASATRRARTTTPRSIVQTKCVTAIVTGCTPANGQVNSISVQSTSVVQTMFAKVIGFDSFTVHATATACSPCSVKPLDVMIVLDRTGSMCQKSDGSERPSRLHRHLNAKEGIESVPQSHEPPVPPRRAGRAAAGRECLHPGRPLRDSEREHHLRQSELGLSPRRALVGLRLVARYPQPRLDPRQTIDCVQSAGAPRYADAIDAAQKELVDQRAAGRAEGHRLPLRRRRQLRRHLARTCVALPNDAVPPGSQLVDRRTECQRTRTSVYTIGYDLNGNGTDYEQCHPATWNGPANTNLEQPPITSLQAMQGIASVPVRRSSSTTNPIRAALTRSSSVSRRISSAPRS